MATEIDILQLPTADAIQAAEAGAVAAALDALEAKEAAELAAASVPSEADITTQIEALAEEAVAPKLDKVEAAATYAVKGETVNFRQARVDRLGASKLAQSQALALKAKADGKAAPAATTTITVNGQNTVIYFPPAFDYAVPMPLVIHLHGADATATSDTQWKPLWEIAQASGFIVATSDFHGNAYGAPSVIADVQAVFDAVLGLAPVNGVILSSQSMGSVAALNALTHNVLPSVLGAYLAQPVVSLRHRYDNGRGPDIRTSYGIAADGSDYDAKTSGYDPNLEAGAKFGGVPFYITSSPSDPVALKSPFIDNLIARLAGYSPVTFRAATGGHGDASHFVASEFLSFLRLCAAGLVPPTTAYDFKADGALLSDFDAATLSLTNGAQVASWAPARGSVANAFAQTAGTMQPIYTASDATINNVPVVAFGPDDFLDTGAWATPVPTPATVICVAKLDVSQPPQPVYTGRNGVYMYGATVAGGVSIQTASTGSAVTKASAGAGWRIMVAVYDGSSSRLYVNSKTATAGTTGTTAQGASAMIPGFRLNTTSAGTAGIGNTPSYARFAAIGRALTNTEVADVFDALNAKYKIALDG